MLGSGRFRSTIALVGFVAICFAVSAISGAFTASSVGSWYQQLSKPAFNPPDWVFAPVWTVLYILIAISGWRIWRHHGHRERCVALGIYAVQLAVNVAWSGFFFGAQWIGGGLAVIGFLIPIIAVNVAAFWRIDRRAAALLVPYFLWVGFAAVLNTALWRLNSAG